MKNKGFRVVEDVSSADFIFEAAGDSLEELFRNCAAACFFAMTDLDKVEPVESSEFEIEGDNPEDLLFNFISELIFLKDTQTSFFSFFEIKFDPNGRSLNAVVRGERIDYNKHVIKTDVKAATYHDLQIRKKDGRYQVRMILDL